MDRFDFLMQLGERLQGLPEEDIQKSLDFYGEMIDERVEEGMSEQEAVAEIGTPSQIAESIWKDVPFTKVIKARVKHKTLGTGNILLLALGSPIWLSLGIVALAGLLAVYVCLWAVAIALWAAQVTFIACAVAGIVSGGVYFFQANVGGGLFLLGCGILLVGLAIFMHYACVYASKAMGMLGKQLLIWTKMLFVKKEKIQ